MSYRRQSFLITLTFLASFYYRPSLTAQTTFSQKDIQSLSKTVREFQNAWYVKQDPKKFRKFFAADSPHLTGQAGGESIPAELLFPGLFGLAFIDNSPNPNRLLLHTSGAVKNQCLNKNFGDYMCITELPGAKTKYVLGPILYVAYSVSGPGFSGAGVASYWIKRGRKWKLHTILPIAG